LISLIWKQNKNIARELIFLKQGTCKRAEHIFINFLSKFLELFFIFGGCPI
jgi:hypothetical protein